MKIKLQHNSAKRKNHIDTFELAIGEGDTQVEYSYKIASEELFLEFFCDDYTEVYFDSEDFSHFVSYYSAWGKLANYENTAEFVEILLRNLISWFLAYPITIPEFINQLRNKGDNENRA